MSPPPSSQEYISEDEGPAPKKSRKRVTVEQAVVLQHAFQDNPHPGRETRTRIASELGMELRAVNHWFQNKRQATKRKAKSQAVKGDENEVHNPQSQRSVRAQSTWPTTTSESFGASVYPKATRPVRATVSLNDFLNTPSKPVEGRKSLWDHMLSSPPHPIPLSPSRARLSPSLYREGKKQRSLEWACAHSRHRESDTETEVVELDSETDVDEGGGSEAVTDVNTLASKGSRRAATLSPAVSEATPSDASRRAQQRGQPELPPEEMEAAMVLLDFMRR